MDEWINQHPEFSTNVQKEITHNIVENQCARFGVSRHKKIDSKIVLKLQYFDYFI